MPMGVSQYKLAARMGVPARRINEIVHGLRAITPDTSLRLARVFGMSDRFWLNLQMQFDLDNQRSKLDAELDTIEPLAPLAS